MNTRAFTLLELLISITIVVILAGLSMAAYVHVKKSGYAAKSASNLRQLVTANQLYAVDNGHYAPAADRWNNKRWCGARASEGQPFDATKGYLSPYLGKSAKVTPCRLFVDMVDGGQSFEEGAGGYGYNSQYIGGLPGGGFILDPGSSRYGEMRTARPAHILNPVNTLMFATTAYARREGVQEYPFAEPPYWDFGRGPTSQKPSPSVHFRFNEKAIVAWCDGHISMETRTEHHPGANPHGGDAWENNLGWFGPVEENGFWNPRSPAARGDY